MPTKPSVEEIWKNYDSIERRLSAPLSERMLDLGRILPDMNILDLATGRGEPAIPAAKRVAPDGRVHGCDTNASVLKLARARADREGLTNVDLSVSNMETLEGIPTGHFDVALSRWGLMYVQNPIQALRCIRKALVPGGLLVIAAWSFLLLGLRQIDP